MSNPGPNSWMPMVPDHSTEYKKREGFFLSPKNHEKVSEFVAIALLEIKKSPRFTYSFERATTAFQRAKDLIAEGNIVHLWLKPEIELELVDGPLLEVAAEERAKRLDIK